jgi:hypothetical protein
VPVCRAEVLIAEPALIALAQRLRDSKPIWPVGVARARVMLTDSLSPLYVGGDPGAVRDLVRTVLDDLDDGLA